MSATSSSAEVTFKIPALTEEEAKNAGTPAGSTPEAATIEKSAPQIAKMTAEAGFWNRFGVECGTAFKNSGLGGSAPAEFKPADRLAALETFEGCVTEFQILLASQADDSARVFAADSIEKLVSTKVAAQKEDEQGKANFLGLSFGVGVGISYSEDDVIPEAQVGPGNVIIATKDDTTLPRVILESHYYDWCNTKKCRAGTHGIGPYFGIVAKSDKLISAFSTGVMFGWKDTTRGDRQGFSVGFGALLDDDVKSLANGFEEGKPLPPGETGIRFEEKSRWSGILFFTRTF